MLVLKQIFLGLSLAATIAILSHFGIKLLYPAPEWQAYQIRDYAVLYEQAEKDQRAQLAFTRAEKNRQFLEAQALWAQSYFYLALPGAIIILVLSGAVLNQTVAVGLIVGAVMHIANTFLYYWTAVTDSVKFISLIFVLIVLLLISYDKFAGLFFYERKPGLENKAYKDKRK